MPGTRTQYRIGEAARLLALKTCVLRFWEGEFPQLAPLRTPSGQRLYSEADMALLFRIRSLLHEQGMTIAGARRVLRGETEAPCPAPADEAKAPAGLAPPAPAEKAGSRSRGGPEQGSLFSGMSVASALPRLTETIGNLAAARDEARKTLTDAVAELESLRDLLRAASAPSSPSLSSPGSQGHPA